MAPPFFHSMLPQIHEQIEECREREKARAALNEIIYDLKSVLGEREKMITALNVEIAELKLGETVAAASQLNLTREAAKLKEALVSKSATVQELSDTRLKLLELQSENRTLKERLALHLNEGEFAEAQLRESRRSLLENQKKLGDAEARVVVMESDLTRTRRDMVQLQQTLEACESERQSLMNGLRVTEQERVGLERELEKLRAQDGEAKHRIRSLENDVRFLSNALAARESAVAALECEIEGLAGQATASRAEVSALKDVLSAAESSHPSSATLSKNEVETVESLRKQVWGKGCGMRVLGVVFF